MRPSDQAAVRVLPVRLFVSVCLSVRPSRTGFYFRIKVHRKPKIGVDVPQSRSKGPANVQLKRSKGKRTAAQYVDTGPTWFSQFSSFSQLVTYSFTFRFVCPLSAAPVSAVHREWGELRLCQSGADPAVRRIPRQPRLSATR